MPSNSDTYSIFECCQLKLVPSSLKDFITLSISDCERHQKRQSSTYITHITVLDTSRQRSDFLIKNHGITTYLETVHNIGVRLRIDHIGLFLIMRTKSHCPPSLLKCLGISIKIGSPLGISAWAKEFLKSIL